MPYEALATTTTPALIIYVLDVSASMSQQLGYARRLDVVTAALEAALQQMVFRSTKGAIVLPRYRVAMFAYSDHVYDVLGGIKPIDYVAAKGVPELMPLRGTNPARALAQVEALLEQELPRLRDCPAPLVCHMTDGEYNGADPEPIARRLMALGNPDGGVLLENIFISDNLLSAPIPDPHQWPGILPRTRLLNDYAKKLRAMSSPLPSSYRLMMLEAGYRIAPEAAMMLPGMSPELVEMGFVMSTATPVAR